MLATFAALALLGIADPPARTVPPTPEELQGVTNRGRDLAGFDAAVWQCSEAVEESKPRPGSITHTIARKTANGWMVAFGRLDKPREKFQVAFEATQANPTEPLELKAINPPRVDTGYFRSAARAIDAAMGDFKGLRRAYNTAVLPAEKGQFLVYVMPAPTKPNAWPLGGDVRYLVAADGLKILEKRTLHDAIIEVERPRPDPQTPIVPGVHNHTLDDVVEDTDVFHVLARKPAAPEKIIGRPFSYEVGVDGSIKVLGKADEPSIKK